MTARLTMFGRSIVGLVRRGVAYCRDKGTAFGELWRHSLQVRVTISTLALSSAVVFVLGMVLQNQITERLIDTKERAAMTQLQAVVRTAEKELVGDAGQDDALRNRLDNALKKITSRSVAGQDGDSSAAGTFEPVLAAGDPNQSSEHAVYSGPYEKIPDGMRNFVENDQQSKQIHTVDTNTYLLVGAPVTSTTRPVQLYLMFSLSTEQSTVATVQNTLLIAGLALLALLAGIANLVTRQVVHPVRRVAEAAEKFGEGDFDRRLEVAGRDDLAKLADSYNAMATSIQEQFRQLEEFGQLQRRFTSDVSHELRTPLTTIRMAADVLYASREDFSTSLARSVELLMDDLDRFEELLHDLLEISRLDAGVAELSAESWDVRDIAHQSAEQVRGVAGTAGSRIEMDLPEEDVRAEVDSRRVERVLRNLLANAVDHSNGLPVELRLAANDDAVAFTVRDHGVGLQAGEADWVFHRFWRADSSRDRQTGGTGLGLAISQEDARLHAGWLEAWGEPNHGSCFRLTLPRTAGEQVQQSPLPLDPEQPAVAPTDTTVDEPAAGTDPDEPEGNDVLPAPRREESPVDDGPTIDVESEEVP